MKINKNEEESFKSHKTEFLIRMRGKMRLSPKSGRKGSREGYSKGGLSVPLKGMAYKRRVDDR